MAFEIINLLTYLLTYLLSKSLVRVFWAKQTLGPEVAKRPGP